MQPDKDLCRVCGLKAHGFHFGVLSCRACAAFFRRFVVLNLKYNCLKDQKRCNVDGSVRGICRQCRFEKCLALGMTADNVQLNRDSYKNREFMKKKTESDTDSCCSDKQSTSGNSSVISEDKSNMEEDILLKEVEHYHEKIHATLNYYTPTQIPQNDTELNTLQRFTIGLQEMRKNVKLQSYNLRRNFTKRDLFRTWTDQITRLTKWVYHSKELQTSSFKQQILMSSWSLLTRVERIHLSLTLFGAECLQTLCFFSTNDEVFDMKHLSMENQSLSLKKGNEFTAVVDFLVTVGNMLLDLMPTNEEFVFIMVHLLFVDDDLPISVVEAFESLLNTLSNELHEFYAKHNVQNYAARALKLMKIVTTVKKMNQCLCKRYSDDFMNMIMKTKLEEIKCVS